MLGLFFISVVCWTLYLVDAFNVGVVQPKKWRSSRIVGTCRPYNGCRSFVGGVSSMGMLKDDSLEEKLPFETWLAKNFPEPPLKHYLDPTNYRATDVDTSCIIDQPDRTLSHKMIDFDVSKATNEVLRVSAVKSVARIKPIVVVVRGIGGGKTRCLEEIRYTLLTEQQRVLPIAVTYNHYSGPRKDPWLKPWLGSGFNLKESQKQRLYALSIAARIVSAVVGLPYHVVAGRIDELDLNDKRWMDQESLIQQAVRFAVSLVNRSRALLGLPLVDTFVLMIDESLVIDKWLNTTDLSGVCRSALLDRDYMPGVNTAVILTSLDYLPEELALMTPSRRVISVVELPHRLTITTVLNQWWGVDNMDSTNTLNLIAASMNSLPRALEMVAEFIKAAREDSSTDSSSSSSSDGSRPIAIDGAFVQSLYASLFKSMSERYNRVVDFPSIRVISAMFFQETLPLNGVNSNEVLAAITESVITNPITDFYPSASINPETSIVMLKVAARRYLDSFHGASSNKDDSTTTRIVKKLVTEIDDGVQAILDKLATYDQVGDVLELALQRVLYIRVLFFLAADPAKPESAVNNLPLPTKTLASLCGLQKIFSSIETKRDISATVFDVMTSPLGLTQQSGVCACEVVRMKTSSYGEKMHNLLALSTTKLGDIVQDGVSEDRNRKAAPYLAELDGIVVNEDCPFALILPHSNTSLVQESWDVGLKFYHAATNQSVYLLFDAKSGSENNPDVKTNTTIDKIMSKPQQYIHTKNVFNDGSPHRMFMYVYISTYEQPSCIIGPNAVVVGRNDSLELLGPFHELYKVARDTISKRAVEQQ